MNNVRYRLNFEKMGKMKFVGHLDLLKLFQRAIRRAKLPVYYSNGFNPHQETIFAMPLTLGMTTSKDVIDIRLTEEIDKEEIMNGINKELPNGFVITDIRVLKDDEKNCAKELAAADYLITSKIDILNLARAIYMINQYEECLIVKKSKKTTKLVDIKNDIYEIKLTECGVFVKLSTGSKRHIKPELIYEYICGILGEDYKPIEIKVLRTNMYRQDENNVLCEL